MVELQPLGAVHAAHERSDQLAIPASKVVHARAVDRVCRDPRLKRVQLR